MFEAYRAIELLNRLLKSEITVKQFYVEAGRLPEAEMQILADLIKARYEEAKALGLELDRPAKPSL
jgi:undecaprenyl pyrophosphate synthase